MMSGRSRGPAPTVTEAISSAPSAPVDQEDAGLAAPDRGPRRSQRWPTTRPTSAQAPQGKSGNQDIGRWPPTYELIGPGDPAGQVRRVPRWARSATSTAAATSGQDHARPPGRAGCPAAATQQQRGADAVEDVDPEDLHPAAPEAGQHVLLQPEQVGQHEHQQPAAGGRPRASPRDDALGDLALEDDRRGDAHQEQEQPRGDAGGVPDRGTSPDPAARPDPSRRRSCGPGS